MNIAQLLKEHDAQNAVYQTGRADLPAQPDTSDPKWIALAETRLDALLSSLSSIPNESLLTADPYIDAVDTLVSFFDDVVLECALLVKRREEVEEKLLTLLKLAISKPTDEDRRDRKDEHVVSNFIDGLIMNEVPLVLRSNSMTAALLDDTNPLRLGLTYYKSFCNKYTDFADKPALSYLETEEEVRFLLLSGQNSQAAELVAKLFESAVKTPEKFLLMALNSFYSGFAEDAVRSLEIGLEAFPGDIRLAGAKEGLLSIDSAGD